MVRILELDIENTYKLYEKSKKHISKGNCYYNTYKAMSEHLLFQFDEELIKIGYCYIGGEGHQLIRHCVIITNENKIIDVSCPLLYTKEELKNYIKEYNIKYYIFAELNNDEYMNMIEQENLNPELEKSLRAYETEMLNYIKDNNLDVNLYDFSKYLVPIISEEYLNIEKGEFK